MKEFTGLSLIEILVTMVIMSFIIGGIFAILSIANLSWNSSMGLLDLQQGVRQAMDGMTREARQSRPTFITIANGGAQLDFFIPNISNVISYYVLNNQIIREHPTGTSKVLANDISSLNFCCLGGADCMDCANSRVLQIQIQADKIVRGRALSFALQEKARLRNE